MHLVTPVSDSLVQTGVNGQVVTTSEIVASNTDTDHASVIRLIRNHEADFEDFGRVGFEIVPFETAGGVQSRTVALLNRDQALLLITYMRNTEVVRGFKKALIKAFADMEKQLNSSQPAVPQDYKSALLELVSQVEENERLEALAVKQRHEIELQAPKVLFADSVATSGTVISVADMAKILCQNGIDTGQKRLFAWLRENGYLIRRMGTDYNMPTQRAMELGLFHVTERSISKPSGDVVLSKTVKVTGRGQQYFVERFLDGRLALASR